jgi:hypothetical protein
MPFEYARLLDNFNRPDANPLDGGYSWCDGRPSKLVSNTVAPDVNDGGRHNAIATGVGYMTDCGFHVEMAVFEDWQAIGCRWQNNGPASQRNGYILQHNNGGGQSWELKSYINNADGPIIASGSGIAMSAGDALGIQAISNALQAWVRIGGVWQFLGGGTSNLFSGGFGVMEQGTTGGLGRLDNFWGGALPQPGFTSRIRRSRGGVWT